LPSKRRGASPPRAEHEQQGVRRRGHSLHYSTESVYVHGPFAAPILFRSSQASTEGQHIADHGNRHEQYEKQEQPMADETSRAVRVVLAY